MSYSDKGLLLVQADEAGEVPENWRIANVVPLFKKCSRDNPGNYRLEVTKMIDEGKTVEVVYTDFSKAFDIVPHGRDQCWDLFITYINDLEQNVAGLISKFADDTKVGGFAEEEDCPRVQQDI
eukprot:g38585.t1